MSFDPEKVDYYNAPWSPIKADGRERHQQYVQAQDFDQLLKLYKEIKWMYEELCH